MVVPLKRLLDPDFLPALRALGTLPNLTVKQRYALARGILQTRQRLEEFEEARVGLVKAFGVAKGDEYLIPKENAEALGRYNRGLAELLDQETQIYSPVERVVISGQCPLTAGQLAAVMDLVEVTIDETEPDADRNPKPASEQTTPV